MVKRLRLGGEEIPAGAVPRIAVVPGMASPIATGGMLPRGADAEKTIPAVPLSR